MKSSNKIQYIIISVITILIILIFVVSIIFFKKYDNNTYKITNGGFTYDENSNLIEVKNNSVLKMDYNGNYKLSMIDDLLRVSYNLGNVAIINNESSSDLYLYGVYYQILSDGTVSKLNNQNIVSKIDNALFFKISDRKYLLVDKNIVSNDGLIKTKDYLIVEIDKNGNSKLYNNYINVKTINPIVLSTSLYDFDVANELLITNKNTINLKKVIGSSNMYEKEEEESDEEVSDTLDSKTINSTTDYLLKQNEYLRKQIDNQQDYYNSYFNTLKNTFNNLTESLTESNQKSNELQQELNETKKLVRNSDMIKWLSLGIIQNGVSTINVNYNVFDPTNEYTTVFIYVNDNKHIIDKSKSSILVRNLSPNTVYQIKIGYTLKGVEGEVIQDVVSITTENPSYELKIKKKSLSGVSYYLKVDKNYICNSAKLNLYSDGNMVKSVNIEPNEYVDGKTGFIEIDDLGLVVILKLEDVTFDEDVVDLNVYSKIINSD